MKYKFLEEVEGKEALEFVQKENEKTLSYFKSLPVFNAIKEELRPIFEDKEKISWPSDVSGKIYNFWTDGEHQLGLWRRQSYEDFQNQIDNWETVLDFDALSKLEGKQWVFSGSRILKENPSKALIYLSDRGKDSVVVREFDLDKKVFIENGFFIGEAKSNVTWISEDEIWVATECGDGSLTESGYPRIVKSIKRNGEEKVLFEGLKEDISVGPHTTYDKDKKLMFVIRSPSFFENEIHWKTEKGLFKIPVPLDADFKGVFQGQIMFSLQSPLTIGSRTYSEGSVLSWPLSENFDLNKVEVFFEPTEKCFYSGMDSSKSYALLETMEDVKTKLEKITRINGVWTREPLKLPEGKWGVVDTSDDHDRVFLSSSDFLTPTSLWSYDLKTETLSFIKATRSKFKSDNFKWSQHFVPSKDGTMIPYFLVCAKDLKLDGTNPTLLYAYGGFQDVQEPFYLGSTGKAWVEKGGVYVLANIRGGAEYGPKWHQAALRENRVKAFEDFETVARDLINKGITAPNHLGIEGGSNGGLLVGAAFTRNPELYGAVLCQVPLLDMLEYHKLLAGASWMEEYGNPDDPTDRKFLESYSPFHNVFEGKKYPKVLFMTSTKDDRVHPVHARKMVKKMKDQGHDVWYFENINGGHGGSSTVEESLLWSSLEYVYLWDRLK